MASSHDPSPRWKNAGIRDDNSSDEWRRLGADEAESFVSSTELRCIFIEDDGNGNILEQAFEVPLVFESLKETAIFHFFKDFDGDAAGDINAAEGENFEREIAGFGAVNIGPEVEGFDTDGAGLR